MKNKIKSIALICGISLAALATSCSDPADELKSVSYDRLFSPVQIEARVQNKTGVRLSWAEVKGATSYSIELFANDSLQFSGSPVATYTDIKENIYSIAKLEGETKYSARIQAIGQDIPSSKWNGVYFKTDAEQILMAVVEADLTPFSVTLRWPAGETATEIAITPGNITHTVTPAEITAGAATISGLTPEVAYTAKLKNGVKTRGTMTFTTLVDLGGAIAVSPEDDFKALLEAANDGDSFALYPGTYSVEGTDGKVGKFEINKSIEIKAVRPGGRPVLNGCIVLNEGASLTIKQVVMDGTNTDGSQAFEFKTATAYAALIAEDCEIRNYVKGLYYVNVAATIDLISFNNCLMHSIECSGGDMFDCRSGAIKQISLTNSTVYNSCAARDFVRYDDKSSSFPDVSPLIKIDRCTLNGVCNEAKRLFYVRFARNSISFSNNLVTNTKGIFGDSNLKTTPTFNNNNYFEAPGLFTGGSDKAVVYDDAATKFDPGYADAAKGDFTVSNEDVIYKKIGDPRWIK